MHTRRSNPGNLFGTVAALGIAAMLAGPTSAQDPDGTPDPRTGNLHEDCKDFNLRQTSLKVELEAWCRTSDDNEDTKHSNVDLSDYIGNDNGALSWGGSDFHEDCTNPRLTVHSGGVTLTAECDTGVASPPTRTASLELNDYLEVDEGGSLEFR